MLGALRAVPLSWLPAAVTLSSIVVLAGVMSRIVSPAYEWLIPSSYLRVARGLDVLPLARADREDGQSLRPGLDLVLLVGAGWAEGSECASHVDRSRTIGARHAFDWHRHLAGASFHVAIGRIEGQDLHESLGPRHCSTGRSDCSWSGVAASYGPAPGSPLPSALGLARMWYDHVARLVAFTPWLGDRLTNALWSSFDTSLYRTGEVIFLVFVFWWTWLHRRETSAQAVLVLVLGMSLWTVLAVMARPYALAVFQMRDEFFYDKSVFVSDVVCGRSLLDGGASPLGYGSWNP